MGNLVVKVEFSPQKMPAKNVLVDIQNMLITWEQGERSKIAVSEMADFLNETKELLEDLGEFYIRAVERNPAQIILSIISDKVIGYWNKWGPLYPLGNKAIKLDLSNLFFMGFTFLSMQWFWEKTTNPLITSLIDSFFETVGEYHKINKKSQNRSEWKYWYFDIGPGGKYYWQPSATKRNLRDIIRPYIKLPTSQKLNNILTFEYEAKYNWIRESVMQNVADYVSAQNLTFEANIKGEEMTFTATANNLYLIFLVNRFFGPGAGKIIYCVCGCGLPLTKRQKKFATEQCRNKLRDKDDLRKVISWLRGNKNRRKLAEEKYKGLCSEARNLYEEGYSNKEIQDRLREKF